MSDSETIPHTWETITLESDLIPGIAGCDYKVRKYTPPDRNDLEAYKSLIREFKERFLHFVDSGYTVALHKDLDKYIEHQRAIYEDSDLPTIIRVEAGRMLCTGVLARAFNNMEEHIDLRIQEQKGFRQANPAELQKIYESVSQDLSEATPLPRMVRKGGGQDINNARVEMLYEPFRIFTASIHGDGLDEFYRSRIVKIAQAMHSLKQIDQIATAILDKYPVTTRGPTYGANKQVFDTLSDERRAFAEEIRTLFPKMVDAASTRIQILHNDSQYQNANLVYKATRNRILELTAARLQKITLESKEPAMSADVVRSRKQEIDALYCLNTAVGDAYDIAITHNPHPNAIELLKTQMNYISTQQSRNAGKVR